MNFFSNIINMTELITILSTGKGTWADVAKLINNDEWSKIFIITNEFGKSTFNQKDNIEFVIINPDWDIDKIRNKIIEDLKDKIKGTQIALNFVSGSGKEHMATLSALLKMGLGIRLITYSEGSIKEL
jgi:hypothetical protein